MDQWLIDLSAVRHPGSSRKTVFRTVSSVRQGLMLYLEGLQGFSEQWVGKAVNSGEILRVTYLGDDRAFRYHSANYLQHLLFQPDSVEVSSQKSFPMINVHREAEKVQTESDLVIIDANGKLLWQPASGCCVRTPNWIRMEFIFEPDQSWEDIEQRFRAHKNNVKRIHHNGFQYRISHSEEEFDFWYDRMYVPLIESRHGDYGAIDLKESMRKEFQKGFLLMIDDSEGTPIAGQLTYVYRKSMYSLSSGILDGSQDLHSKGALAAIYYYSLKWCYENGMERFEMGGCRPFETNGLFQYKRRWGMTPTPDLWGSREWLFWAPKDAPVAVDWLNANPVVGLADYWRSKESEAVRASA
jgi:hypothetical protein